MSIALDVLDAMIEDCAIAANTLATEFATEWERAGAELGNRAVLAALTSARRRVLTAELRAAEDATRSEPRCGHCGGLRDKPRYMSDDSYARLRCPHPFHGRGLDHPDGSRREAGA